MTDEGKHHRRGTSLATKFDINLDKASLLNSIKFRGRFDHMCIKDTPHSLFFPGCRNVKTGGTEKGRGKDHGPRVMS